MNVGTGLFFVSLALAIAGCSKLGFLVEAQNPESEEEARAATSWSAHSPVGWFDGVVLGNDNKLYAGGWGFDPNSSGESIKIKLCIIGSSCFAEGTANLWSDDVNAIFGIGGAHRFMIQIPDSYAQYNHAIYVHAVNIGRGSDTAVPSGPLVLSTDGATGYAWEWMLYGTGKHAATIPTLHTGTAAATRHFDIVAGLATSSPDIIFLGDSITQAWEAPNSTGYGNLDLWTSQVAPMGAANLGVSEDQTQNVLWRLLNGECPDEEPKLAVLLIGVNNLFVAGHHPSVVRDGVQAIIRKLQVRYANTKVLLVGILPTTNTAANPYIESTNALLKSLAGGRVTYIDVGTSFKNGSQVNASYYYDGIHLSPSGFEVYWNSIKSSVSNLSGVPLVGTGSTSRRR